jgi:hypothetical protein
MGFQLSRYATKAYNTEDNNVFKSLLMDAICHFHKLCKGLNNNGFEIKNRTNDKTAI